MRLKRQGKANAHLSSSDIRIYCSLTKDDNEFLELAVEKLGLSTRAHHKILKISRTLADMEQVKDIEKKLPEDIFMRVHRSYILNFNKINSTFF